jgi:methylmalonyl-CoA mutase cobalamin-binding subunit
MTEHMAFLIGGVFPPRDDGELKKIGFDAIFRTGATQEEIVSGVKEAIAAKKKK